MNQFFTIPKAPSSKGKVWRTSSTYSLRYILVLLFYFSITLFFPGNAKAAIGDYISGIDKDKAAYSPGAVVNFTINLKQPVTNLTLKITYYQCNTAISTQSKIISGTSSTWAWVTPNADYKGFLVKAEIKNGNNVLDYSTIGVDVSSNWSRFPRYGFLSKFGNLSDGDMDVVINKLNRYQINGLQFYDWMDTHQDPLAGTASNPSAQWNDLANRPSYFNTVKGYIDRAHNKGMKAMFYNLLYGAYPGATGVSETWGLFRDNTHTSQYAHTGLPSSWETTSINVYDPGNTNWQSFLNAAHNEVYNATNLHFDGYHTDQLGDFGTVYNYNGTQIYPDQSFDDFLNSAKAAQPGKSLVMNAVNQFGQQQIGQSPVDFTYSELWTGNEEYYSLGNVIQQNNGYKNVNTVLAAYVNKGKSGSPGLFNPASVLMADAVIFAFGGAHIELGEHMLGNEYFPNSNLQMSATLEKDLLAYYDFSVAYENILRDGRTFNSVTLSGGTNVRYWPPVQGKVATVGAQWGSSQVFHVLNYSNAQTLNWRDDNQVQPAPATISNLALNFPYTTPITRMWVASPDFNQGQPQAITYTQSNGVVNFSLPSLKYWSMVVAETGSAMSTCAAPSFNPVSGSSFTAPVAISLTSSTPGAIIRYTTDGSTPTSVSPMYTGPFTISNSCTIKTYSSKAGMVDSPVSTASYTITLPAGVTAGGTYKVLARHSSKALDVKQQLTADGTIVYQYEYLGAQNQKWRIDAPGNGFYKLIAVHSQKAMDVVGASTLDGAAIHQWSPLNVQSQDWSITSVGSGYFKIVNRNSGKALDVYGAGAANETPVNQYTYAGGLNQQFSIASVSEAAGVMSAEQANALDMVGFTPADNLAAQLIYPNPAANSVNIRVKGNAKEKIELSIYTTDSKVLYKKNTYGGSVVEVNTSAFAPGVYLVKVQSGTTVEVMKLLIKR